MSTSSLPPEHIMGIKGLTLPHTVQPVSMNEALQGALKKFDTTDDNIIIRCETLPKYEGTIDQMKEVFEQLFTAIFNQPFNGSKLFLYVDCRERNEALRKNREGFTTYEILVHSNVRADEEWRSRVVPIIKNCEKLLAKLKATITMNSLIQKGCMFIISLQGKY